jgi:hypothetical protein
MLGGARLPRVRRAGQLFGTLDDHNRFKIGEAAVAHSVAPPHGALPTMDGFVADYISTFTGEIGQSLADVRRIRRRR